MKKWITMVLTAVMAFSIATTAFAATPSPSLKDRLVITSENGQRDDALIYRIDNTEETDNLIKEFLLAQEKGDVLSVFPEEIEIIPNAIILDVISLKAKPEVAEYETYTVLVNGIIGILKDKPAQTVIKADDEWFQPETEVVEDDALRVTFDQTMLRKMVDAKNISMIILMDPTEE